MRETEQATGSQAGTAPPCVFVVFGATGDLMARKIAPALYNLFRDGHLNPNVAVLGVARRPRSDEQFRDEMLQAVKAHSRTQPVDEELWRSFARRWHYHVTRADRPEEYQTLKARLAELDGLYGAAGGRLFHIAMTPDTYEGIAANLGRSGLNRPQAKGGFVRLIIEKPFGHDLDSAERLTRLLMEGFSESQVYRIDHYLGKQTVQNILVLRFANAVFEPVLNRHFVDHVQISAVETAGMEGRRGPYYEKAGALRDMVQSHLLQLVALTAMEPPACVRCEALRDERAKVLAALRPLTPQETASATVRGQYAAGPDIAGYHQEPGVDATSQVETYVALRLFVDNWRWAGVPFYLRTGKRLAAKASYVVVTFKHEPVSLFGGPCDERAPNRLIVRIHPDEGMSLAVDAKVPGTRMLIRPVKMSFSYGRGFEWPSPEAYEHLLLDAMCGDATLFIRNDEVESAWRFVDSIRRGWAQAAQPAPAQYAPLSWGPPQADGLFRDPTVRWYELPQQAGQP